MTPPPATPSLPPSRAATAVAPEWRQTVTERFEQFQHRRARLHAPVSEPSPEQISEEVPQPDLTQKVIAFEDIAAERIEPVIVGSPPVAPQEKRKDGGELAAPQERRKAAGELRPPDAEQRPAQTRELLVEDDFSRDIICPHPVAPLLLRGLAGLLDLAVATIAVGVFLGTFHLLGGTVHFSQKAGGGMALAAVSLIAFYLFFYTFYGAETPGLQWMGLRVLDHDGYPPHAGQRLMRAAGLLLSAAAVGLGYLWALADEEGLTWHDRMSKTFVTTDPGPPESWQDFI